LAQASNDRITFVSALDQRNKRGYDILLFRPLASTGQKAKAVTLYEGHWHKLEHNIKTRRPYLGIEQLDIHKFDRESLPSDNEQVPESSDEEPAAPRPESEDSSDDEPMQCYTPAIEQRPASLTASDTNYTYYGRGPRELLPSNTHRSSIATLGQEQQQTSANMVTETIATTTASITVQPESNPAIPTNTQTTASPSQRIVSRLQTALRRTPGGSDRPGGTGDPGGPGGPGGPRGPGGPGGPEGPGGPAPAPATPAAPAAANHDNRLMGSLPQAYEGDRKLARTFLDQLVHYFQANSRVPGLNSPICRVSIALTLFQGQQTTAWVRNMGAWIDSLDPVNDDIQEVWTTFIQEFNDHFADSQS
jgi:hypothetical protein